jgi:hypothetical protein
MQNRFLSLQRAPKSELAGWINSFFLIFSPLVTSRHHAQSQEPFFDQLAKLQSKSHLGGRVGAGWPAGWHGPLIGSRCLGILPHPPGVQEGRFSRFDEERLKDHRKQTGVLREMAERDAEAVRHVRVLYPRGAVNSRDELKLTCTQQNIFCEETSKTGCTK